MKTYENLPKYIDYVQTSDLFYILKDVHTNAKVSAIDQLSQLLYNKYCDDTKTQSIPDEYKVMREAIKVVNLPVYQKCSYQDHLGYVCKHIKNYVVTVYVSYRYRNVNIGTADDPITWYELVTNLLSGAQSHIDFRENIMGEVELMHYDYAYYLKYYKAIKVFDTETEDLILTIKWTDIC